MKRVVAILFLPVLLLLAGCATGRVADLRDCGRVSVGVGLGLEASAKLGCVAHPSLGVASYTYRVGAEDRRVAGVWEEGRVVWPVSWMIEVLSRAFGGSPTPLVSYSVATYTSPSNSVEYVTSWLPSVRREKRGMPSATSFGEATDLEVGATALVVSARAGVNPLEILDFLLGWVGLDIARDDPPPAPPPPP